MFGFKKTPAQTLRAQYGTPWEITLADGSVRRPMDDEECVSGLLDYLNPTPANPIIMRHEGVSEEITSYYAASLFLYTHLFKS